MSELYTQDPGNVASVSASGLLLSCLALLMSSLVTNSHFLFSYLVKPVAFLGPLFVTTFLVLQALFMLSPGLVRGGTSGNGLGSVLGVCSTVLNKFRSNVDEGTQLQLDAFECSEVYKIIFKASDQESGRHGIGIEESEALPVDKFLICGDQVISMSMDGNRPDKEIGHPEIEWGKKLVALFQDKPCRETDDLAGMKVEARAESEDEHFNKIVHEEERDFHNNKCDSQWMKGSEAKTNDREDDTINSNNNDNVFDRRKQDSRGLGESDLRGFGWTRGKQWSRTLECKLMEERRHDMEGERMDSLWETYNEEESLWSSEEEGMMMMEEEGLSCCLQALRLSAGKIGGLEGIGRRPPPYLVRISKAFRGIGWFYHPHRHVNSHSSSNNNNKHVKKCKKNYHGVE